MTLISTSLADSPSHRAMRHGVALVAVAVAMGLRLALEEWCGPGLPPFITFYPMVMAVSMLAGFAPGGTATLVAALTAAIWVFPPIGEFSVGSLLDQVATVTFVVMGLLMSLIAEAYRRNRDKAETYEREAALRASQAAVREGEALFRAIFDNNLDAALLTTPEGEILAANAEASRIFGRSQDELRALGRPGVVDLGDPRLAPAL
jgi:PAS domain-containing protein